MTDPTTPQAIAARLTPRQRKALLWLPADGTWREMRPGLGRSVPSLVYAMIVTEKPNPGPRGGWHMSYALTPLGRRVREEVARGTEVQS